MSEDYTRPSTGLPNLDDVLQGLAPGDNIVWQIDNIDDYRAFVEPFSLRGRSIGQGLTYFRFACHEPLLPDDGRAEICRLFPERGFEAFISKVHDVISEHDDGRRYVFDSLSELALDCYSDRMIGNFFSLTCPYLLTKEAVAYFAVLRNYHSSHAATPISKTTQIFIDVFRYKKKLYIHPLKVSDRFSPTLYRVHVWEDDTFATVNHSAVSARILNSVTKSGLESAMYRIGVWNRMFVEADEALKALERGEGSQRKVDEMFHRLLRMTVTRDERLLQLAEKYFHLSDIMRIRDRMIGTGFIGGKTVGMLLARRILLDHDPKWSTILEAHDSFYVGSEVFYSYIVYNDCWWARKRQKNPETFLDNIDETQERILHGQFPSYMIERFKAMLEYYGQCPIIVRSSSLLEDGFGNAFAGKYESVFCVNQGPFEERLACFLDAIRFIYASSMSESALTYRAQRGILDVDEQMALLVQRVSGSFNDDLYFPHVSGVGLSFNPFIWDSAMDPDAGVVRLVFGLGTRAVERADDDYTRLVSLSHPKLRPEDRSETRRYTQRKVDVLSLDTMQLETRPFAGLTDGHLGAVRNLFLSPEDSVARKAQAGQGTAVSAILDFEEMFARTHFLDDLKELLRILGDAYEYPVDIEFAVNCLGIGAYKLNLLQCRPFRTEGSKAAKSRMPVNVRETDLLLKASGTVIGPSLAETIDRIVYVVPSVYGTMPERERYSVARLVGKLTRRTKEIERRTTMLLGPGRWGTTMPSLGVPVAFAEISGVTVLGEIVSMREGLIPDVSLGTHFFNNLVEFGILYFAVYPEKQETLLNHERLESFPNQLAELIPEAEKYAEVVRVIDFTHSPDLGVVQFFADTLSRTVSCHIETPDAE